MHFVEHVSECDELFGRKRVEHHFRRLGYEEAFLLAFAVPTEVLGPAGLQDECDCLPLLDGGKLRQQFVHTLGACLKDRTGKLTVSVPKIG